VDHNPSGSRGKDVLVLKLAKKSLSVLLLLILAWVDISSAVVSQSVYVAPRPEDCVNTYLVRLIVTGTNIGSAYGDYEGSRYMIVRKGAGSQPCWLEMSTWTMNGELMDNRKVGCIYMDPYALE